MNSSIRWQEINQTDTVVQQLAALLSSHVLVDTVTSFITSVLISCVFFFLWFPQAFY